MKLLVGLGNPEDTYQNTRHNIGFAFLDYLVKTTFAEQPLRWEKSTKFHALFIKADDLLLLKPQTYMNNSGLAVKQAQQLYKIQTQDILIFHDELDLPFGTFKISQDRGDAGHNGVKSLIQHLGTSNFSRWRIGIKGETKNPSTSGADYVLDTFTSEEEQQLLVLFKEISNSVNLALTEGIQKTMNTYNRSSK